MAFGNSEWSDGHILLPVALHHQKQAIEPAIQWSISSDRAHYICLPFDSESASSQPPDRTFEHGSNAPCPHSLFDNIEGPLSLPL